MPPRLTLGECQAGDTFCLSRVVDQSPEFLRFLSSSGLTLGTTGRLLANHVEAGTVTIETGTTGIGPQQTTLGREAAEKILVTRTEK